MAFLKPFGKQIPLLCKYKKIIELNRSMVKKWIKLFTPMSHFCTPWKCQKNIQGYRNGTLAWKELTHLRLMFHSRGYRDGKLAWNELALFTPICLSYTHLRGYRNGTLEWKRVHFKNTEAVDRSCSVKNEIGKYFLYFSLKILFENN